MSAFWEEGFENILREFLPDLPAAAQLEPDIILRDFGLDSLAVVGLLLEVESAYDIAFPDEELNLNTFSTPAKLWETIVRVRGSEVTVP